MTNHTPIEHWPTTSFDEFSFVLFPFLPRGFSAVPGGSRGEAQRPLPERRRDTAGVEGEKEAGGRGAVMAVVLEGGIMTRHKIFNAPAPHPLQ